MLTTRICGLLGIELPILNAPMGGGSACGELAAAVSLAGGLGLIGAVAPGGPDWLREQIRVVRERTDRPFGVGFISHRLPQSMELYEVALAARVPVIAHSFTDPAPYMEAARQAGCLVLAQVRSLAEAEQAQRAGVDVVVAQGTEAGGHTGSISTLTLLPQVVDLVAPLPVLGAGGIADGRGLAAALMLGAEGAWLGTAFLACPESGYAAEQKQQILRSAAGDSVLTRSFDLAGGGTWPAGVAGRALRNDFSDRWDRHEDELEAELTEVRPAYRAAARGGDWSIAPTWAGDGAGLVRRAEPAGGVVRRIAAECEQLLRERSTALVTAG